MATLNLELSSSSPSAAAPLEIARFQQTPHYREENMYLLCKKLSKDGIAKPDGTDFFVVFISNEKNQIPLWHQRASHRADGVILWDYHVTCVQKRKEASLHNLVWYLDSSLPGSISTSHVRSRNYSAFVSAIFLSSRGFYGTFTLRSSWNPSHRRDRHMKDPSRNRTATPPLYEVITAEDGMVHNLNEYTAMSSFDVMKSIGADAVNTVLTEKLGMLVGEVNLGILVPYLLALKPVGSTRGISFLRLFVVWNHYLMMGVKFDIVG